MIVVDGLTITVDVSERRSGVPALLAALGVEVTTLTLAVGDYAHC
jgi:ERCC4-type nuclease